MVEWSKATVCKIVQPSVRIGLGAQVIMSLGVMVVTFGFGPNSLSSNLRETTEKPPFKSTSFVLGKYLERYSSDSRGFPAKEVGRLINGAWV